MRKWIIALIILVIFFIIGAATLPGFIIGSILVITISVIIPIIIFILAILAIKKFINYKREQLQVQKDILNELRKDKAEY